MQQKTNSKMPESLRNLENKLGYWFRDQTFLKEATTHDSLRVSNLNLRHYERLEHLGDSVIQLVITEYLFKSDKEAAEGTLSTRRSEMVNKQRQNQIARELELHRYIDMAPGVKSFVRYDKFLEAIIGAIYIDLGGGGEGLEKAKAAIYKLWKLQDPPNTGCTVM